MNDDQNSSGAHKTALVALPLTFSDIVAQIEAEKVQRAALRPANKAAIFAALAVAGVASVTVTFDGYGDCGQIEGIDAAGTVLVLPDQAIEHPVYGAMS